MRQAVSRFAAATGALVTLSLLPSAAEGQPRVALEPVGRFAQPVHLTHAPGDRGRLFVVERGGRVRILRGHRIADRPFLDQRRIVDVDRSQVTKDHGGLLSLAFSPRYRRDGLLYVFYTHRNGTLRIDELRRSEGDRNRVQDSSRRVVLSLPRISAFHFGGQIAFGPDGLLYVGLGDQDDGESAQDLGALRGKLLRIDPREAGAAPYRVPARNPFVGTPGTAPEVFSYGLRNPWRFSFDGRGRLALADVGDERIEELDFLRLGDASGANFGWNVFEGSRRVRPGNPTGHVKPVLQHGHEGGYCSITGGHVVTDKRLGSLRGRYLYSDLCNGTLRSVRVRAGAAPRAWGDRSEEVGVSYPVSFGLDGRGRSFVASLKGRVYRLDPR